MSTLAREAMLEDATRSSSARGYNLPIPFGWFAVARSAELGIGEVKALEYFDTSFVIWRGEDGVVRALDAYCSHLGAHLGYGGEVVGNDLRCPFHHWRYDGEGAVTKIPYTKVIPPKLRKPCETAWPVRDHLGLIMVWRHPQKAAPMWELSGAPEIEDEKWVQFAEYDWTIKIHIQEITENGMDYPHFTAIHGVKSPPIPKYQIEGFTRQSVIETKMDTPRGLVDGKIAVRATGPGQSFTRFHGITDVLMYQQTSPISVERTHVRWQLYRPDNMGDGEKRVSRALTRDLVHQIEQDIPIWEHKRYTPNPMLVEGDGPLLAYREQYARYYATDAGRSEGK